MLRRVPIESNQPLVAFAWARVALAVAGLASVAVACFPEEGRLAAVVAGVAFPWALLTLILAYTRPGTAFHPLFPAIDMAVLVVVEAAAPDTYGAVRFTALLLISVHAHLQGEARGLIVAAGGVAALIATALLAGAPVSGGLLVVYELTFAVAAIGSAVLLGRTRTTESTSRLRARDLTRRTLGAEAEARRRLAESIHDGPLQELIGLDMMLSAARQATDAGEPERAAQVLAEARKLTERNVESLRDEIVGLGPAAFEELSFEEAVQTCLPTWQRRYGIEVELATERFKLSSEMEGDLFRIVQEAVTNAGRHAHAETVSVHLHRAGKTVELRVSDDGEGFGDVDPLGPVESGHLGLAAMRERAALLYGELRIETSGDGTSVVVRAPLPAGG